jgi:hypothetical protein
MRLTSHLCIAMLASMFLTASGSAQGLGGSTTTVIPPGSIKNASTTTAGKINAWVARTVGQHAIALHIGDTAPLTGTFRQYSYNEDDEKFIAAATSLRLVNGTEVNLPVVPFELERYSFEKNGRTIVSYKILYSPSPGADKEIIGYVRFNKGNFERKSSDLIIRLLGQAIANNGTATLTAAGPCDEPPADDVGEEELIFGNPNAPGTELPAQPVASSSGFE